MHKVYLLSIIPEGYKEITLSEDTLLEKYDLFCWNGTARTNNWNPPNLEWLIDDFSEPTDISPDITSVSGVLTVNSKAKSALNDLLENQVEFLPANGPDDLDSWFLVNITNVLDLMDTARSKFQIKKNGKIGICEHAYISAPPAGAHIFKVRGFEPHIFASESVYSTIENAGLTGGLLREYQNP